MFELLLGTPKQSGDGDPGSGPGPSELIGGDLTAGFYGEIASADFINATDLAAAISLGCVLINNTTPWLKFALDNKTVYIPKKPIRNNLAWTTIYTRGAVYGSDDYGLHPISGGILQNARVTFGGRTYKVRLIRGANVDPVPEVSGINLSSSIGSEWDRLMYNICSEDNPNQIGSDWATYSLADLGAGASTYNLCMENSTGTTYCLSRSGQTSLNRTDRNAKGTVSTNNYWRPMLVLES